MKALLIALLTFSVLGSGEIPPYHLKSKDGGGSCFDYSVIDKDQKEVELPAHIDKALECASSVGIHGHFLSYVDGLKVKIYNLKTKEDHLLFTLYNDIDGFSSPIWSSDGSSVAYVIVNQNRKHNYKESCRIMYLTLKDNGAIDSKRKFDRPVNYSCGSTCSAEPGDDFKFNEKDQLIYRKHLMQTDGEEIWEVIDLD